MRIGKAFDIHRLVSDRPLILGGLNIPFEKGLLGHSDADVLLHAVAEAILGALGLGDLGTFFPDTDPKYKGIDSKEILTYIYKLMIEKNYEISNLDSTLFLELPKMRPYIDQIRNNIALLLNTDISNISVKATTFEKLDSIGRGESIAAECIVLLKKIKPEIKYL